uniref:Zinc finger protein 106 n=1 Tax=Anolis carolinensis TaxID=28377 RepID=A0A803T9N0_ANOCA
MPVGRIECPPSPSFPRDSNHECQVCRVTVVGLSAYAKHISSQLHKDNVEAHDAEDGKEEANEQYFDKELIQLIQKRNKQNRADEMCRMNHGTEGDDRHLQRQQNDRTSYQDRDVFDSSSRYRHGPSQRDWKWEKDGFSNPRQGKFTHSARKPNNMTRHLTSQRGRPGWHPNNLGGPSNWYHNYGNPGGAWHMNSGGGTSSWHHSGRGRNSNWNSKGNNIFSNWQAKNTGGNWKSGQQKTNEWNSGRSRAANNNSQTESMDASWLKSKGMQDKYRIQGYVWQWQEHDSIASYADLANENDDMNSLLDFTSDQLSSDQLLNFVSEQLDCKTSKINGKGSSPSREKTNRWAPYPSQKTIEQHPLLDEKTPEKTGFAHSSSSQLSVKLAESKAVNSKGKKWEETYSGSSNNKMVGNKFVSCRGSTDCTIEMKTDQTESKSNRMPSLKSPLLAIPDMKSSSQKRSPKNLLKQVQLLLSSSSGECQSRVNMLNVEGKSSSSYGPKLNNNCNNCNYLKDSKHLLSSNGSLTEELHKTKEELQCNCSSQNTLSSTCRGTQTDRKDNWNIKDPEHDLKMEESQTEVLENESHRDVTGNQNTVSNTCSPCAQTASDHTAAPKSNYIKELDDADKQSTKFQMDLLNLQFSGEHDLDIDLKASLEEDNEEDTLKSNSALEDEGCGIHSNHELQKDAASGHLLPELSKLGFPAYLQRDLTWRTSLKSKTGSHLPEPNLNSARRIRNVSGHRKSETEKESGLKPTLRQIISVSRRNVNWEQVIQQVTKKKQELGKGLPRFGIEMVPLIQNEQEGLDLDDEADLATLEGFQWEGISIGSPGTVRKRSLSESSVAIEKTASVYSFFSHQRMTKEKEKISSVANTENITSRSQMLADIETSVKQESTSLPSSPFMSERADLERQLSLQTPPDVNRVSAFSESETQRSSDYGIRSLESQDMLESPGERYYMGSAFTTCSTLDIATDSSCTSGNEQNDSQGTGKKRRATGEGSSPEIPSLERKNKRRKIKGKKERSQVDQLLSVSLREEELNKSLQCVDGSLVQARAALQAAYIEVQRLMMMKHQISVEMGTLRTQRIQILQGLQESFDPSEHSQQLCSNGSTENRGKLQPTQDLTVDPGLVVPLLESVSPLPFQLPAAPLAATIQINGSPTFQTTCSLGTITVPDLSVQIKQECTSPKPGEENRNGTEQSSLCSSQTVSKLMLEKFWQFIQFSLGFQQPSLYPAINAAMTLSGLLDFQEPYQDMRNLVSDKDRTRLPGPSSISYSPLHVSVQTEEEKVSGDKNILEQCSRSLQNQTFPSDPVLKEDSKRKMEQPKQMAVSTLNSLESKMKKKKKLKKKKALRAAARVPENSDTEQDVSDSKPLRKIKTIKAPKGGNVTTSSLPKQEDAPEEGKKAKDENESDTSLEFVEVPKSPLEVVTIPSSESGDEKPDSPSKRIALSSSEQILREASRSGYDEVSSTSEIGTLYRDGVARSIAETQMSISTLRGSKNSSEVSSEPGEEEEPTEGVFEGHSASVNAIQIFGNLLYTCSADKTIRAFNLVNRKCVGVFEGHTSKVNCLLVTHTTGKNAALYSGSSDHSINCYNIKTRKLLDQIKLDDRVLCLHSRWRILYAGLANGNVVTFNIKNNKQLDVFECHGPRAISCLATAQEGARRLLIVGSYDSTISVRDARNGLLLRTLEGHSKTVLCMKVVNDLVFSGSSDQSVHAHNIHTGELVRIYKGHNHAVTVVNILGKVMVTACLDKCVRVYELQSHDRLQVYGGHSDMIMCMTIHKSMIYTGCYDGSIQAVRLNLMQNYRCWWHGCSLIFGVVDHLKQHLLNDHTNPNFQTLKCRWKNCDAFFTSRKGSKQDAVGHIEKHAEDDSKIDP